MANPCGLSYAQTVDIIKYNVLEGNYNGRAEVMKGLLGDGFSYPEATEVTNLYFKIYRRIAESQKIGMPALLLTSEQKAKKKVNNIVVDYLNGNLQGFPMEDVDIEHLKELYKKVSTADTPTLKEKYNEEANVFVQRFLPNYTDELFKTSVYARPLLSAVFFVKSITSNIHAQVERTITDMAWDGKSADFTWLGRFMGLANTSFLNVLKGGTPATNLYQTETNIGASKGRLEEFSNKGTSAEDTKLKSAYYGVLNIMSKFSNRFNSAPDTRGIFANAERHMYQLLKEKYRAEGLKKDEAQQKAFEDMELSDRAEAVRMAEDKFKQLGLEGKNTNGSYTTEFNVAVAEYQRLSRDEAMWSKALSLSKNDFWKKNMTVASEMGFGDYGIFGMKAQLLAGLRDKMEKKGATLNKGKFTSAFNLFSFGFLNGAANFAEDALERVPLYAAVKLGFLQAKKSNISDVELGRDIARRQRDIIVKNVATGLFFVAAKMAEKILCPDYEGKQSTKTISSGRTQTAPCGYPLLVPPQMMAAYKMYAIIDEATDNDEDFFETALNVLPVLSQSNAVGLGGAMDKYSQQLTEFGTATAQGGEVRASEVKSKLIQTTVKMGTDVANSFLPIPSRLIAEAGTVAERVRGIPQKIQSLPFAIDEIGNKKSALASLGKVTIAALGNVTGVSEIANAAMGANKPYAVDWLGRKIIQFRGSDITGSGIRYTVADDIIATAGVKTPYMYRLEKVDAGSDKDKLVGISGEVINEKINKVRYMTDEEYFDASVALGKFNKNFIEKNEVRISKLVAGNKELAADELKRIFDKSKKVALQAIGEGVKGSDDLYNYIDKNWEGKKRKRIKSRTVLNTDL